jgi:hypothetical protein
MAKRDPNSNKCSYCGERFVVDSLARDCELKHQGVQFKTAVEALIEDKKSY